MSKLLSVIIVTYNCEEFIRKCINSTKKYLPKDSEIIVIDNSSTDKTGEILEEFKDSIKLISSESNLGFGKACNKAAKEALGEYLFLLNPDTEIIRPIFEELIEFYKSKTDLGILAPKLIMPNGNIQPSVMNLPTVTKAFKEFILNQKNSYLPFYPKEENPTKVECAFGAAWLISRKLYENLGGFDERYFLYYEDIDMCRKMNENKKTIYYYPKASILHLVGGVKSDQKYSLNFNSSIIYNGLIKTFLLQAIFKLNRFFK